MGLIRKMASVSTLGAVKYTSRGKRRPNWPSSRRRLSERSARAPAAMLIRMRQRGGSPRWAACCGSCATRARTATAAEGLGSLPGSRTPRQRGRPAGRSRAVGGFRLPPVLAEP